MLVAVACTAPTQTPTPAILRATETPPPTVSATATRPAATSTSTRVPSPTKPTATPRPTITPRATRTASWTPLPTLPPTQARQRVLELLQDNGGCRLPCWWGVAPGSAWAEADQALRPFATSILDGVASYYTDAATGAVHSVRYHGVTVREPDGTPISSVLFKVVDGLVDEILPSTYGTDVGFSLARILTTYALPDEILIDSGSRAWGYAFNITLFILTSSSNLIRLYLTSVTPGR